MNCFKKHIASLFLLGFLFPQAANAIHHFAISHDYYAEGENKLSFTGPAYEYHSCDYHLSGVKFLIPEFEFLRKNIIPGPGQQVSVSIFMLLPDKVAFNFSVRGPPLTQSQPLTQKYFLAFNYLYN